MDVIVVEGTHDEDKIKLAYPDAFVVVTNGSEVSKETLDMIKKLSENNNIIIFTDPDYPGERIRNLVSSVSKNVSHAFLKKKDCISSNKKKVGIEHASVELIKEALDNVYVNRNMNETITNNDLFDLGLIGNENSAKLRFLISDYLNIGHPNSKTFLKRLNFLGLTKKEVEDILCKLK